MWNEGVRKVTAVLRNTYMSDKIILMSTIPLIGSVITTLGAVAIFCATLRIGRPAVSKTS